MPQHDTASRAVLPISLLAIGAVVAGAALIYLFTHDYTVACFDENIYDDVRPPGCEPDSKMPTIIVAAIGGALALLGLLAMAIGSTTRTALEGQEPSRGAVRTDPTDALERAAALHRSGVLTDSEFAEAKRQILRGD